MKYNHAYDICFSLESDHEYGEDVTADMLRTALLNRIKDLDKGNEWGEIHANSAPFDTYEIDEEEAICERLEITLGERHNVVKDK